ncbi:MAG: hypothetical protein JST04_14945 [Bdellovibrionales bacterium]|nr:hypothetical protein [Bdellovibrionales bacterium]
MLLGAFLALATSAYGSATPTPVVIPSEIVKLADGIRTEKVRTKRLALFSDFQADLKRRVGEIPENIPESDVPKVQILYELDIYLGALKPETMNPANCGPVLKSLQQMANPTNVDDSEVPATGRLALDVVKAACAP